MRWARLKNFGWKRAFEESALFGFWATRPFGRLVLTYLA